MQKLTASDPGTFFNFGNTLTLHNGKAIVAADVTTVDGHTSQGKVYIFLSEGGTWSQFDTLTASDGTTDDFLVPPSPSAPAPCSSAPRIQSSTATPSRAPLFFNHTPDSQ